jgi:hypothetical protein
MTTPDHLSVEASVQSMIQDAQQQYSCLLRLNQSNRSAKQAQQFHVCHMYLHNFFKYLKPKPANLAADGKTIAWRHLSSPTVKWDLVDHPEADFLKTRMGSPAERRNINGVYAWVPGREPDQQASTRAMSEFLARANVTSMAAPGIDGCGEPCACGGHASKHTKGLACDVGGMEHLGLLILQKTKTIGSTDDALDHFLASHNLWRPLAHIKGKSREAWHLEALPHHIKAMHRGHGVQHHDSNRTQPHNFVLLAALRHERLAHKYSC